MASFMEMKKWYHSYESESGEAYGSNAIGGQRQSERKEELGAVGRREQSSDRLQLQGQLLPETPVLLVVQLEEIGQTRKILAAILLGQQRQKIAQVLQHSDANLSPSRTVPVTFKAVQVSTYFEYDRMS